MIQLDGTIKPTAYGHQITASVVVDEDSDQDQMRYACVALSQALSRTLAAALAMHDAEQPTPDTAESLTHPSE